MGMVNVSNLGFGGSGIPDSLPKAIAELQGMKLGFVDGAAAGTVMPVPGMDPEDHIGSVLNMTDMTTVDPTTISVKSGNAQASITCKATGVDDGDKVVVNGKTYTFKDVVVHTSYNPPPGTVPIDINAGATDPEVMADRLAKAIMSGDAKLTTSVELDAGAPPKKTKVVVKVRQPGTAGNAYTLTETGGAVTLSGATFTGGADASSQGFTSTANLAGKKLLVLWYDKRPGSTTVMPLAGEKPPAEGSEAATS